MKKFKVTIAVDVPSSASVEVDAATAEAARRVVLSDIAAHGWNSRFVLNIGEWTDDWANAKNLRVIRKEAM